MSYTLKIRKQENNFFIKLKIKLGKILAKDFPHYKVRLWGLRLCGFEVGSQVYIGQDLIVTSFISDRSCNLIIKDRVSIGPRVTLLLASDANWSKIMETREVITGTLTIEEDCWIGAGAIIFPRLTIGARSIIGAGSVVTRDLPPESIVAGVPARNIKKTGKINWTSH
ncbi:MAG: hypothetical protein Kow0068_12050 [Marinilabiliales bacterium]